MDNEVNLFFVCLAAFAAVLLLLSAIAVMTRLLTWLLPHPTEVQADADAGGTDSATVSAIATAAASIVPGGRVTRIKEHSR